MKARGLPLPKWATERPTVPLKLAWFYKAWWELDSCRSYTEGQPLPIPWTAVYLYARHHHIDVDYLYKLVASVDFEYIKYRGEKLRKEFEKNKAKRRGGGSHKSRR